MSQYLDVNLIALKHNDKIHPENETLSSEQELNKICIEVIIQYIKLNNIINIMIR